MSIEHKYPQHAKKLNTGGRDRYSEFFGNIIR